MSRRCNAEWRHSSTHSEPRHQMEVSAPPGRSLRYVHTGGRQVKPQSWYGHYLCAPPGIEPRFMCRPVRSLVTTLTAIPAASPVYDLSLMPETTLQGHAIYYYYHGKEVFSIQHRAQCAGPQINSTVRSRGPSVTTPLTAPGPQHGRVPTMCALLPFIAAHFVWLARGSISTS
jgi:hypothetical protein